MARVAGWGRRGADENEVKIGDKLSRGRATLLGPERAPVLDSFANFATQQGYVKPQSIKRVGVGNRH